MFSQSGDKGKKGIMREWRNKWHLKGILRKEGKELNNSKIM
jgi:hypothetical protein